MHPRDRVCAQPHRVGRRGHGDAEGEREDSEKQLPGHHHLPSTAVPRVTVGDPLPHLHHEHTHLRPGE
eukprot:1957879-Rhodomonas_salina.2